MMKIVTSLVSLIAIFILAANRSASLELSEGSSIKTFEIDLDLPPEERWIEVMTEYREPCIKVLDWILENNIPKDILPKFIKAMDLVENFWPKKEYRKEIEGIAKILNRPVGLMLALNINYELNAGCTSIVAQSSDGTLWHGRNLDYFIPGLQDMAVNVRFVKDGGKFLFEGTTYAGYIGLLTGLKHDAFSLSIDARNTGGSIWDNLIELLFKKGAALPFMYRDVFQNANNYDEALVLLQNTPMIASSYLIIAGIKKNEGAVITRNRNSVADTWEISNDEWFLVETNDDHWKPPEDKRRDAANKIMNNYNPNTIDSKSMMSVLNTCPILNEMTTYSAVMNAGNDYYYSILQNVDGHKSSPKFGDRTIDASPL